MKLSPQNAPTLRSKEEWDAYKRVLDKYRFAEAIQRSFSPYTACMVPAMRLDVSGMEKEGIMPVFISHRTADDGKARLLAQRLMMKNIQCYLDDFDPEAETTRAITNLIVDRINMCTHLMALVTNATMGSWWVPFEIGVARQGDRRITTYDASTVDLPEYLTEWPVMTSEMHLDLFAETYHRDRTARPLLEKYASAHRPIATADDFHSQLKRAVRAGRL